MRLLSYFSLLATALVFSSCLSTGKSGTASTYSENISGYRPQFENMPVDTVEDTTAQENVQEETTTMDVTGKVDGVIDEVIKRNEDIKYINGYTIQVYSGPSRENADELKSEIYTQIPEARPVVNWDAPNYKVHVGSFLEKLEAQKTFTEIKEYFPQAILIPRKIPNTSSLISND